MRNLELWAACSLSVVLAACRFDLPAESARDASPPTDVPADPLELEFLAGDIGGPGNLDGTGATAHFNRPAGIAVDSANNLYIADHENHTIRKVTSGVGVVTTLAGTAGMAGSADGTGAVARFDYPADVAVDGADNIYVADLNNQTIRKITPAGVVTTLAGTADMIGSANGTGAAARFASPSGVAVDGNGNVYVADTGNEIIRKITAAGVVTTFAGTAGMSGSTDGTGAAARFYTPEDVGVDSAGNVYVADMNNQTIRKITPAGAVTTLAGSPVMEGSADGTGAAARFWNPQGVTTDAAGNVYVADSTNDTIRKITAAGVVTTLAGTVGTPGSLDGTGTAARFHDPQGVAINSAGTIFVADTVNSTVRRITTTKVVTTLAGTADARSSMDGTVTAARFNYPSGVAADAAGTVYVVDQNNHTIRKIAAGVVTTLAGTAGLQGTANGTGAAARFNYPSGVAVDGAGNVYVTDLSNFTIRKITAAGAVTTFAGTAGMAGSTDGTGAAARFERPEGLTIDSAGTLYVSDSSTHSIRRVTAAGVVTTVAGATGMAGSTDGTGAAARFNYPAGLAVDPFCNIYVADRDNSVIRKIALGGVVTTLAGTAGMTGSTDGTGAAARFDHPTGVAVDRAGNVYVADQKNSIIRKITAEGVTTTIAGTAGMIGILLGAVPRLAFPVSLAIVGDSLVISDTNAIVVLRHGAR